MFRWLRDNEEFRHQYEIAKEASADALAEDMLEIADDPKDNPQNKRVRIDTRKWIASKLKPKKYGHNRISSGDEDAPTIHRIV